MGSVLTLSSSWKLKPNCSYCCNGPENAVKGHQEGMKVFAGSLTAHAQMAGIAGKISAETE